MSGTNDLHNFANFLVASEKGGIEKQEAQGQQIMVVSDVLPIKSPKDLLLKLGFVWKSKADDLFDNYKFPAGWKKIATDHSMWSKLIDNKGRTRASIFYKAAFYDRSAHMYLDCRYHAVVIPEDNYKSKEYISYIDRNTKMNWAGVVMDWDDKIIFNTTWKKLSKDLDKAGNEEHEMTGIAEQWLNKHFPDYKDPMKYWD